MAISWKPASTEKSLLLREVRTTRAVLVGPAFAGRVLSHQPVIMTLFGLREVK